MRKKDRQKIIAELLEGEEIKKQEDFVIRLKEKGIPVTQATISRDIKEMHLVKVPSQKEGYRYSLPVENQKQKDVLPRLKKLLKTSMVTCEIKNDLVALKTLPGTAEAMGGLLEEIFKEELFTLMTDDNHILLFAKTGETAEKMQQNILSFTGKDEFF